MSSSWAKDSCSCSYVSDRLHRLSNIGAYYNTVALLLEYVPSPMASSSSNTSESSLTSTYSEYFLSIINSDVMVSIVWGMNWMSMFCLYFSFSCRTVYLISSSAGVMIFMLNPGPCRCSLRPFNDKLMWLPFSWRWKVLTVGNAISISFLADFMRLKAIFCIWFGSDTVSMTSGSIPSSISLILCIAGIAFSHSMSKKYCCCSTNDFTLVTRLWDTGLAFSTTGVAENIFLSVNRKFPFIPSRCLSSNTSVSFLQYWMFSSTISVINLNLPPSFF